MPRRRYTAKERAQAAGIAVVEGVTEAERQTGIPKTTIQQWTQTPEYVQMRTKTREEVADQMWAGIQVGLREVVKGLTGDAPLRDKSVALGILYDKHALLTGGATGRMESRELNDLPDSTYVDAIRAARDIARGGRTGADAPLEAEPAG